MTQQWKKNVAWLNSQKAESTDNNTKFSRRKLAKSQQKKTFPKGMNTTKTFIY